jgi:hypothetical protein
MRVARVLALHEDAIAAEDRRSAVALDDLLLLKVNLRVDPEAAHDPGNRIPGHLDKTGIFGRCHGCSFSLCEISAIYQLF